MFPAGAVAGPVSLSPTQKRVYRGSPIYKALSSGAMSTQALHPPSSTSLVLRRTFRTSGGALSPIETSSRPASAASACRTREASCSATGQTATVAQLRAAAVDQDLSPFIRGRANLVLAKMGLQP